MSDPERWEVRQIQLDGPPPAAPGVPDAKGVYLQLWRGDVPLGHLWLDERALPVGGSALRQTAARAIAPAVGDHLFAKGFAAPLPGLRNAPEPEPPESLGPLAALSGPLGQIDQKFPNDPKPAPEMSVSVVVCTRGRPESLRNCLTSLARLDPAATEVIVVDNGRPDDGVRAIVCQFPGFRYLTESEPGLSRARNAGLRAASGEIIAWTDDDVVVSPGWIGKILRGFATKEVAGLTGLVLPERLETSAQVRFERGFGGFNRGYRALTYDAEFFAATRATGVPVWAIGAGANMAFRREVFAKVGHFDDRLGAGAAGCSEDSEMWYRMLAAGMTIRYEPLAVVWHAHRADGGDFQDQMAHYMRGHAAALLIQHEKHRHAGNLRRLFLSLPMYYWRVIKGTYIGAERGTVWHEILGCLRGIAYYLRNVRSAHGRDQRPPAATSG